MDSATNSSHWCYNCSRFVNVNINVQDSVLCCDCQGGFVEQIDNPPTQQSQSAIPAAMLVFGTNSSSNSNNRGWFGFLRRRNRVDGLPYNPIIALRGPVNGGEGGGVEGRSIGFYSYDGGVLQPLPSNESDLLISSGFHHHLDGWANIAVNALGNRPASKAAIEAMPTIEIVDDHVVKECHCAVCKEDFEIGSEAKEMPCKHIYHLDCIQPWLAMRNTCPLCRHELPSVTAGSQDEQLAVPGEENNGAFGLVIWRLPTRSLAVVRFSGGRPEAERLISFFTSTMETSTGVPIVNRAREGSGGRGLFQRVSSLFRRNRSSSGDSAQQSTLARSAQQNSPANETAM